MENVLKTELMEANAINVLFAENDNKRNTITMPAKQAQIRTSLFLPKKAYNMEVDGNHDYFVTNSKILVHNKNISEIKPQPDCKLKKQKPNEE